MTAGLAVPNGSYTAAQTIPAGANRAWVVFDDNINILIRHEQTAARVEAIDNCAGWDLWPGGEGPPLASGYDIEIQGDGATTNATIFYTLA